MERLRNFSERTFGLLLGKGREGALRYKDIKPEPVVEQDWINKLPRLQVDESLRLGELTYHDGFNSLLRERVGKGQRAAVKRILSDGGSYYFRGEKPQETTSHSVTVDDVRNMTDEQLHFLGSDVGRGWKAGPRTIKLLRRLFGEVPDEEKNTPDFVKRIESSLLED